MTIPVELVAETEIALYSQTGETFTELGGRGYARISYAEQVTFKALEDWPPITHIATVVRGEILLRPVAPTRLTEGQSLTLTFSSRSFSYTVGQWVIGKQ